MKTRCTPLILLLIAFASSAMAQTTYTWFSSTTGGSWSSTANWNPNGAPTTTDAAILGSVASGTRVVAYDTLASGTLATLTMSQTAAALNELAIQKNLTVVNDLTLGASSGTNLLYVNSGTTTALTLKIGSTGTGTLTLNSGGVLNLASIAGAGDTVTGNVVISGGVLNAERGQSSATVNSYFVSSLAMSSGTLALGSTPLTGTGSSGDNRFQVNGNLTATGGSIAIGSSLATGQASLFLSGSSNSLVGLGSYDTKINLALNQNSFNQTLALGATTVGGLTLRSQNTAGTTHINTITATSGTIGSISFLEQTATSNVELLLGSNLVMSGTAATTISAANFSQGAGVGFIIDTGTSTGYTLDARSMTAGFAPNNGANGSAVSTVWTLQGNGTIQATSFNLNQANNGVALGGNVILQATGTGANDLSSLVARSISAASTFYYTGSSAVVTSSRTIGKLKIGDGTNASLLRMNSSGTDLSVGGDITVSNNSSFNLVGKNVTETGASAGGLNGSGTIYNSTNGTTSTLTLNTTGSNGSFSGAIVDNVVVGTSVVSVVKAGTGTQTLSGANTYSGSTVVSAGTLIINGSATGGGDYTVASSATLGGTGSIGLASNKSATVQNGGLLSASSANSLDFTLAGTGVLDVSGALASASPSMLFSLDAPSSTVISLTGGAGLVIGSGLLEFSDFTFVTTGSFGIGTYTLFGGASSLNGGTLGSNLTGTIGGFASTISLSGNDIVVTVIPEPSTWAMVVFGGAGLLALRRRVRR